MDKHYTPQDIARNALACVAFDPTNVADFAAGEGSLLRAARERWPKVKLIGTDIDGPTIKRLKGSLKKTRLGKCDFLNTASRARCGALVGLKGHIDLCFLNPPFSCRGAKTYRARLDGHELRCSHAMAFVVTAASYLSPTGRIIAILPSSCFTSDRDAKARAELEKRFQISHIGAASRYAFPGCAVDISIVMLTRVASGRTISIEPTNRNGIRQSTFSVCRGVLPMHSVRASRSRKRVRLIHTTELQLGSIRRSDRFVRASKSLVAGPAIFLSRVGKPDVGKVCLYTSDTPVAISDCIIAIRGSIGNLLQLYKLMQDDWLTLKGCYSGTCAKYVTVNTVETLVARWATLLDANQTVRKDRSDARKRVFADQTVA